MRLIFPLDWVWRNPPNQTSEVTNDSEKCEGWRALVEDFTSPLFDKWFQKMRRLKRALGEDFREKSGFGGKLHRLNNQFFNNQSRKFLDFKDLAEDWKVSFSRFFALSRRSVWFPDTWISNMLLSKSWPIELASLGVYAMHMLYIIHHIYAINIFASITCSTTYNTNNHCL